jgi:hypothetical protein
MTVSKVFPISFVLAAASVPALGHHSVAGQFDTNNIVELTGVITHIDWINPHTYIYLDVENSDGSVTTWQFESHPTAMLNKAGLTSEMIRDGGSTVRVRGIVARDGTQHLGYLYRIDYEDGHFYQLSGDR